MIKNFYYICSVKKQIHMTIIENTDKKIYNFAIPEIEIDNLKKLSNKASKFLNGFSIEIGDIYEKVYRHLLRKEDKSVKPIEEWHKVCDVKMIVPYVNDWEIIASYKDGYLFVSDPTKKLVFKNPNHGEFYNHCDVCKHTIKNSFVIYNKKTDVELQIGCECAKAFGLFDIKIISELTRELNRIYDNYCEIDDDICLWKGEKDKFAVSSVETSKLLKAAKSYYNICKIWKKGYYTSDNHYVPSESAETIKYNIINDILDGDDEYIKNVCNFIKNSDITSDFSQNMHDISINFYAKPSDAVYAFFMIKTYEENKNIKNNIIIKTGDQVKVEGEIIHSYEISSMYGITYKYSILTKKGYTVEKTGVIPIKEENGKKMTSFYAIVKYAYNKIIVDRALKNPNKDKKIIEL